MSSFAVPRKRERMDISSLSASARRPTGALPTELKVRMVHTLCSLPHPQNRTMHSFLLFTRPSCLPSSRSSPRVISTSQLNTLLCVHLWPIYDVVFIVPYSLMDGRTYLRGSFTLRCFQRLSRPYVATQLCRWHDNWCTRGMSIPVLSY